MESPPRLVRDVYDVESSWSVLRFTTALVAADAREVMAPPLAMLSALLNASDGTDDDVDIVANEAAADENVMIETCCGYYS